MKIRYNVEIKNFPKIEDGVNYLVLPNHIAYVDPVLLWCIFRPYINIRPVATSDFSKNPFLWWIFKLMNTITIQEIEKGSADNQDWAIKEALHDLLSALELWDSVLLYPSWRLKWQSEEYIWWKKSAYLTLKHLPKTTKVLTVRTTGLWWSRWSNAWDWKAPAFAWNLLRTVWYFVANLFFFVPRRNVTIDILDQTTLLKKQCKKSLEDFNQCLENFYNENWWEPVQYVKNYFYYDNVKGRELPKHIRNSIESFQNHKEYDVSKFPQEDIDKIIGFVRDVKELGKEEKISISSNLILELYFDSLDMAELKNLILNAYPKASNTPLNELKTVADLVAMALWITETKELELKPCEWNIPSEKSKTHNWTIDLSQNVLEKFKEFWKEDKNAAQIYDAMFWLQRRKDVVLKSFLISEYLKNIPWKYIWVMLPALSSTTMIVLASYLAKKVPVMMNWTHPESAFDHCVKFSKTEKILTSRTFYKTINIEWLKKYDFVFLEDLLKNIPLKYKLKAVIKSLYFPIPKDLDETAVVLYTSWSESLPKAVPLTHKNVMAEWLWTTWILSVHNDETLFCYLPPFHSFWFTVDTIFPIVAWLRSVNTPDPNDSVTVSKLIAHTKPTILATTPTFLKNLLNIAKPEQLTSLRYVITGGEKCSEIVFEKTRKLIPNCIILEWYGITETAPIISINTIEKQKAQSVGIPISVWEVKICDLTTDEELPIWEEWMIYYSWPNVFWWYEDKSLESPFLKEGKKIWYRTWDLWYLDKDGFLFITWRKKRFLKLWWEMISLPFLEELLQEKYWSSEEINLALEGKEKEDGIEIVLFVVWLKLKVKEVNEYLKSKWVSNLIQITRIQKIDSIPLLWTGKVDYKVLKNML